ncbi:MAG TPA: hypothetical protein VJT49_09475 [Amycolatopsis sp.]|uniref:hypothetical protein n=1 Tax=Amycolatopsis sp. TaxID=37632 RepID=UPI002B458F30|nr:hypothetical protein [Amycolatopsis sp.]HKS45328.1 hypothetical protein [Amycolatopsis sp.]
MDQISFFSAEASGPELADLAGLLCGPAQIVSFGRTAARLSVAVDNQWRARILATEFGRRGVEAGVGAENGRPLLRTAFRIDLIGLANAWQCGQEKVLPSGFRLTGAALRLWALAAGGPAEHGYLLALDERSPETHCPLADAFCRLGLPVRVVGPKAGGPAIHVTGRRRLATLAELLGTPPPVAEPAWPAPAGALAGRAVAAGLRGGRPRRARPGSLPSPTHATIW